MTDGGTTPGSFRRPEDPTEDELPKCFIDRYADWACTATDAPKQYHVVNAVVILSAIMAPYLTLDTSYGEIKPNVWSMILAGTTVTRKSTTMDMAIRMLSEVHPDFLMGTDGSPEGILSELHHRDGKVSVFHRDEITGWIESTIRRDYLAGMLETFTRLYDGKSEKRILRKESIEVKDANMVIMSGGIKTKMAEIITMDHIRSGFLPRFIMVTGTTRAQDQRPIGPPPGVITTHTRDPREIVVEELYKIASNYMPQQGEDKVEIGGVVKFTKSPTQKRRLTATPETWHRIQQLKLDAGLLGERSSNPDIYIPLYDRLSNSVIKVAILIAGARRSEIIELADVQKAITLADQWIFSITEFASALESMPEMDRWEKKTDKILDYIKTIHPKALSRSELMKRFRVKSRDVQDIEKTLVQRGQIRITSVANQGKGRPARTEYALATQYETPEDGSFVIDASKREKPLHYTKRSRDYEPIKHNPPPVHNPFED